MYSLGHSLRLEPSLGDAYLKYLSSIYLFVTFPTLTEGSLHYARQKIVSNRSLLRNAIRCDIPQYIQTRALSVKAWGPPNFVVYSPPKPQAQDDAPETAEVDVEEGEIPSEPKVCIRFTVRRYLVNSHSFRVRPIQPKRASRVRAKSGRLQRRMMRSSGWETRSLLTSQ